MIVISDSTRPVPNALLLPLITARLEGAGIPGIDAETLRRFHFTPVPVIEDAVGQLLARFGQEARWAIVPDVPLLILQVV